MQNFISICTPKEYNNMETPKKNWWFVYRCFSFSEWLKFQVPAVRYFKVGIENHQGLGSNDELMSNEKKGPVLVG